MNPHAEMLKNLFAAALECETTAARVSFLDEACEGAPELRTELESLIASHRQAEGYLESREAAHPALGMVVDDRYTLVSRLGAGGMGEVYVADQHRPVRRQVAFKILRSGQSGAQTAARFSIERQALALMDHPHIARVFDAGRLADGRPYIVMELVPGLPITEYCEQYALDLPKRLRLFVEVCRAVNHAHQRGIIHRDLKPTNVLVASVDGRPIPKVIDFGIAKAVNKPLTDETFFTRFGQIVGTPIYTSPEQAEPGFHDLDTRADVYSLGVMLYELLTGVTPFDKQRIESAGYEGMRRILREEDPPRPSTRVSTLKQPGTTLADASRGGPRRLAAHLKGELDWIIMRAIDADRERRYESAAAFAADVERHLSHQPVAASPPSPVYRLRKFARRYRRAITAAALVFASLIAGTAISVRQAIRASRAEAEVERRLLDVANGKRLAESAQAAAERARAQAEASAAEAERLLYASDMLLASRAWQRNDMKQAHERLARHVPTQGEADLRGFEWHYLWTQRSVPGREIAALDGAVYDVELSPDGRWLAVTGEDATVRLFDATTFAPGPTIETQQIESNGLEFSPDSKRIAVTGDDGSVQFWDTGSFEKVLDVSAHEGPAYQVLFHEGSDASEFFTCGIDSYIRRWQSSSGAKSGEFVAGAPELEGVDSIAISAEGILAAGRCDGIVDFWDLSTGETCWNLDLTGFGRVSSVVLSDDGMVAAGSVDGPLVTADFRKRVLTSRRFITDGVQSLAVLRDGKSVIVGDRSGELRIVPVGTPLSDADATREWTAHAGRVYAVAATADGRVISGGADGRVMLWEPLERRARRQLSLPEGVAIAGLGESQFLVGGWGTIQVCNTASSPVEVKRIELGSEEWGHVSATGNARRFFAATDTRVVGWDLELGSAFFDWGTEPPQEAVRGMAVLPNGRTIFVVVDRPEGGFQLVAVDVPSGKLTRLLPVYSSQCSPVVSRDGLWLAFEDQHALCVYDVQQRRVVQRWDAHKGAIRQVQFDPTGDRLASVSADRMLKVWKRNTGALLYEVTAHRASVSGVCFSPDGARIATVGADRTLHLWDGRSPQPLWDYTVTAGNAQRVEFTADGMQLVLWCDGERLVVLDAHAAAEP